MNHYPNRFKVFGNVLESCYHPTKLVLSKPNMSYMCISCYSIKQSLRRTREDNKVSLNVLPDVVVKTPLEYLIPSDDMMNILSIRLFHFLRLEF